MGGCPTGTIRPASVPKPVAYLCSWVALAWLGEGVVAGLGPDSRMSQAPAAVVPCACSGGGDSANEEVAELSLCRRVITGCDAETNLAPAKFLVRCFGEQL